MSAAHKIADHTIHRRDHVLTVASAKLVEVGVERLVLVAEVSCYVTVDLAHPSSSVWAPQSRWH